MSRLMAGSPLWTENIRQRTQEFVFSETSALVVDVGPNSTVSIAGADVDTYAVRFRAEAHAAEHEEAERLLNGCTLARTGHALTLGMPPRGEAGYCLSFLEIVAPRTNGVVVNGTGAAIEIFDIAGPVELSTTGAGVTLLGTTGEVEAIGAEGTHTVFAAEKGRVRLATDLEIDLRIGAPTFEGTLEAEAAGPVRVLLPEGFETALKATAAGESDLVCRADFLLRGGRRSAGTLTYGSGEPKVLLTSKRSTVVFDTLQ